MIYKLIYIKLISTGIHFCFIILFSVFAAFPAQIISPPPQNVTALEGEDIRIPCKAFGAPKPHILWQVGVKLVSFLSRYILAILTVVTIFMKVV